MRFSTRYLFLLTGFAGALLALVIGLQRAISRADREAIRQAIVEGRLDPAPQREYGLFTDEEIDAMIAKRDRIASDVNGS
jgi:hypothetical protein